MKNVNYYRLVDIAILFFAWIQFLIPNTFTKVILSSYFIIILIFCLFIFGLLFHFMKTENLTFSEVADKVKSKKRLSQNSKIISILSYSTFGFIIISGGYDGFLYFLTILYVILGSLFLWAYKKIK